MTQAAERSTPKRVTRDVDPTALGDLLARPRRATLAFVDGQAVQLVPVRANWQAGSYAFGAPRDGMPDLTGREVVLVIDDGCYWFELRGVSVRGAAMKRDAPPQDARADLVWYAIEVRRVVAWDYATIHEE